MEKIGTKVMFVNMGEILRGEVVDNKEELVLVRTKNGKNYLVEASKIVRRIF